MNLPLFLFIITLIAGLCSTCSSRCGAFTNMSDNVSAELWVHSVFINTSECGTACSNFTASVRLNSTSTYLCIIRFNLASSVSCTRPNGCNCTYQEKELFLLSFFVNITTGAGTWAVKSESDSNEFLVAENQSTKSSTSTSEESTVSGFTGETNSFSNGLQTSIQPLLETTTKEADKAGESKNAKTAIPWTFVFFVVMLVVVVTLLILSYRILSMRRNRQQPATEDFRKMIPSKKEDLIPQAFLEETSDFANDVYVPASEVRRLKKVNQSKEYHAGTTSDMYVTASEVRMLKAENNLKKCQATMQRN